MKDFTESTEARKDVAWAYQHTSNRTLPKDLLRMITAYDRYQEAGRIIGEIGQDLKGNFKGLRVLDYGCGAGDYGMALARVGAEVVFYDHEEVLDFVAFRAEQEKDRLIYSTISVEAVPVVRAGRDEKGEAFYDLVIFGEVLEHLDNPAGVLAEFSAAETRFIFTSSYPYRSDDPMNDYWREGGHTGEARLAQPSCRAILEQNYHKTRFDGQKNLWRRK